VIYFWKEVVMARFDLSDFEWGLIQPLLPNKPRGGESRVASAELGGIPVSIGV
jgi:transposase